MGSIDGTFPMGRMGGSRSVIAAGGGIVVMAGMFELGGVVIVGVGVAGGSMAMSN